MDHSTTSFTAHPITLSPGDRISRGSYQHTTDEFEGQGELVPELRILEVMRNYRSEAASRAMDLVPPFSEAQEYQEPDVVTSPANIHSRVEEESEESEEMNSPSKFAADDGHENPADDGYENPADNDNEITPDHAYENSERQSASVPVSLEPRLQRSPKRAYKRAYQKLEEETEEILKGWTPGGNAGAKPPATLEKPRQKLGDAKPPKNPNSSRKPGRPRKIPGAPVESKSRRKPGRPRKIPIAPVDSKLPSTAPKTPQAKASDSVPSRRGRPRGRGTAAGGGSGTKRAANAAPPSKETEDVKKQGKARSATSVHTGRVTKPASRGRGRPRKIVS
ncbi:hypothetical protein E4U21_005023 [Claviceps maximensis]|nr:hypothetical protein E4U21_005023 [Claviceps maximensis]